MPRPTRNLIALCVMLIIAMEGMRWTIRGHGIRGKVMQMLTEQPQASDYTIAVASCAPAEGASDVETDAIITATLRFARGEIVPGTVNDSTVLLIRTADQTPVAATVTYDDSHTITLRPDEPLRRGTNYTILITGGVRHVSGAAVVPWASSFTTVNTIDPDIRFERLLLKNATGAGFTCLQVSDDGMLWASSDDGRFFVYPIAPDGTLAAPRVITSLQSHNNGPRLISGFCFDPQSAPGHPIIWVCNNAYTFNNAPDFSGKLTRLAGADLQDVQDIVVNLPRSVRDHMTNQPSIGPDGAIYFAQGSNSSFGAPDEIWGNRAEHLLNATILRADRELLTSGKPLDVRTPDAGGGYDPFAPDAPVTIYASGIRNAWDLCWHRNGRLYVPVNGSSAGGHAPAGDGAVSLRDISVPEDDWLFDVTPGKYCGHPNPRQGHYVLNGGNPTAGYDFAETFQYPVGTPADPNYLRPAYSFGKHVSANGVIEYRGDAFGGKLKGSLLICRYNVGGDIIALGLDQDGKVSSERFGIAGLSQLANPLDIVEDRRNGNLYISEYGAMRITLFRPLAMPD